MGRLGALAFNEQVQEGNASLVQAVSWHLTSNHYPPHPSFMVPVAVAAIEAGQDEDWDRDIELPRGCRDHLVVLGPSNAAEHAECDTDSVVEWRDRTDGKARAGDIIESFHLDSFISIPDSGPNLCPSCGEEDLDTDACPNHDADRCTVCCTKDGGCGLDHGIVL